MNSVHTFFDNYLPFLNKPNVKDIIVAASLAYASYKVLSHVKDAVLPVFYTERDLIARYGADSWAIVTGASDGVGKEYCFQLAQRGMNVVLMARNKKKLEDVEAEIYKLYPQVKTRVVVADFSDSAKEGFFANLWKSVEDLDVSMLINNVGAPLLGSHIQKDPAEMQNAIIVNVLPQAMLTRYALPHMLRRKHRSAVISVCSFAACDIRPYEGVYSGTKVMNDYLSRALDYEYPNIDFLSVKPGLITTKMSAYKPVDYQTCLPADFVKATLKYLGRENHTLGHWKHRFVGWRYSVLPEFIRTPLLAARSRTIDDMVPY